MENAFNWVLAQLISTWDMIDYVLTWASNHTTAALFWSAFWCYLLDRLVAWTPTQIDDGLWSALKRAVVQGISKAKGIDGYRININR